MKRKRRFHLAAAALILAAAGRAAAVDGVIEINAARVALGGVSPSDAPGYPVTIGVAGSYRLTGPLLVLLDDADAIQVTAPGVTIDLNGFTITGPGGGMGVGIRAEVERTTVRNGIVTEFGSDGLRLGGLATVESVRAIENGDDGIEVGAASRIRDSFVSSNAASGIDADVDLQVESTQAIGNMGDGIITKARALVSRSTASGNGSNGFNVFNYSVVESCEAGDNDADGVLAGTGSRVAATVVSDNGDDGICILGKCTLIGNTAVDNSGHGIDMLSDCSWGENQLSGNTDGPVANAGVQIGANVCNGSLCP